MTLVLARADDALMLVDEIVAARTSSGAHAVRADNGCDLLLAELFDEQRTREIAHETLAGTLDRVQLGTLIRFLA